MSKRKPAVGLQGPVKRCAIYTRKSTTHGLEQEFSSLDAQRESCEAYARSQGWQLVDTCYDDGGFTGANTDRPAFQRLLSDIDAGKIDVVVVYKVDRLSRSLLDFARVMDRFNSRNVAFVSVTQNFSTADAMGRLTLNMLMSFAEFEREMIAERTRDKIQAAKRKGKWTSGVAPFGYGLVDGELRVNAYEAATVRLIFELYLRHRSLVRIMSELAEQGRGARSYRRKKGPATSDTWTVAKVLRTLKSPIYVGQIQVGRETVAGLHEPIVQEDTFRRVQVLIGAGDKRRPRRGTRRGYLLRGLLRCGGCGSAMTPASTRKGTREYRYYRCTRRDHHGAIACTTKPILAADLETSVIGELRALVAHPELVTKVAAKLTTTMADREAALEEEKRVLPKEIGRLGGHIEELVNSLGTMAPTARSVVGTRIDELAHRSEAAQARLRAIEAELGKLANARADADWVAGVLSDFELLWQHLTDENRERLVHALALRVTVGPESIRIDLADRTKEVTDDCKAA